MIAPPTMFSRFEPGRPGRLTGIWLRGTPSIGLSVRVKYPVSAAAVATSATSAARAGRTCVQPKAKGRISHGAGIWLTETVHGPSVIRLPRY